MTTDLQQLQGDWQAIRMDVCGVTVPREVTRQLRYVFTGERVVLLTGGKPVGIGDVILATESSPKMIDVRITDGPRASQSVLGIYEVAGDRLSICVGPERPARFAGVGVSAFVELERVEGEQVSRHAKGAPPSNTYLPPMTS